MTISSGVPLSNPAAEKACKDRSATGVNLVSSI